MNNLSELFIDLRRNKAKYLASTKGSEFENRLDAKLHRMGYSRINPEDLDDFGGIDLIKKKILEKESDSKIDNVYIGLNRHFIRQPFGSQNYPDFLVFTDEWIFVIEAKFSANSQAKPVWNSGLPRPNGIYVFGSMGRKDLTFFRGGDILSIADARKLHDFFDRGLRDLQNQFNQDQMSLQPYGFSVYVRKAFEQKKALNQDAVINFFDNPKRENLETMVIDHLRTAPL